MEYFVVDVLDIVGGPRTGANFIAKIVPKGPIGNYQRYEPNKRVLSFRLSTINADTKEILVLMKINRYLFAYAAARLSIRWFAKNSVTTELFPIEARVPPYENFFLKLRVRRMSTERPLYKLPEAPLQVIPTWLPNESGKKVSCEPISDPYQIPMSDLQYNQFPHDVPVQYSIPATNHFIKSHYEEYLPGENPYENLDLAITSYPGANPLEASVW